MILINRGEWIDINDEMDIGSLYFMKHLLETYRNDPYFCIEFK